MNKTIVTAFAVTWTACTSVPVASSPSLQERLSAIEESAGDRIYEAQVVPEGTNDAAFRYVRFVRVNDEATVSTHLTYELPNSRLIVAQQAVHDRDFRLSRYEEIHLQTGLVSSLTIAEDGGLEFRRTQEDEVDEQTEAAGDPVVVGPTLFGFVLEHWDALVEGNELPVRFAATDQGQSYGFALSVRASDAATTTIEFTPSSAFVRMVVPTMVLSFDTETRNILQYVGRVPPLLDGATIDATSTYEYFVESYR